jgi:hypothetical protein
LRVETLAGPECPPTSEALGLRHPLEERAKADLVDREHKPQKLSWTAAFSRPPA